MRKNAPRWLAGHRRRSATTTASESDRRQQPRRPTRVVHVEPAVWQLGGTGELGENGRSDRTSAAHSTCPRATSTQRVTTSTAPGGRCPASAAQAVRQLPTTGSSGRSVGLFSNGLQRAPLSSEVTFIVPVRNGRGDLGRTDTFTQTDLLLATDSIATPAGCRSKRSYSTSSIRKRLRTSTYNRTDVWIGSCRVSTTARSVMSRGSSILKGASPAFNPIYNTLAYRSGRTMTLGLRFLF